MAIGTGTAILGSALVGGALNAKSSRDAAKAASQPQTVKQEIDPRMAAILFGGSNGNGPQQGLLSRYQGMLDTPQSEAMKQFGEQSGQFLSDNGMTDMNAIRQASHGLLSGVQAPQQIRPDGGQMIWNRGETVSAPSQNGMDLSGSYNSLINGPAGANPYLTGAIQKGINQSSNAFGNMIQDAKSATQDVLGNIRGGAVIAGGYGGSRQGLAEGRAIESMNTQLGRAASQFGQNNTDAAVAAQAGAYDADRNRQLAATQGLGAQQYGVASQNAQMAQQANMANQAIGTNMSQFAAQQGQNAQMANAQMQQQTNALNTNRAQTGMAGLSGLLGQAYQQAGNQDAYALNRAQGVNSLLAPYMGMGGSTTSTTPMYSNSAGSALSGGLMGLQLAQGLMGGAGARSLGGNALAGWGGPSLTQPINSGALQNLNFLGG